MLKDKNDSDADARELVRLIKQYKLPAKVNLIPFNTWPGAPYECSSPERVRASSNLIFEAGISAPIRTPRGQIGRGHVRTQDNTPRTVSSRRFEKKKARAQR